MSMNAQGGVAVITGAASGFGLEASRLAAAQGMRVVMADVQADALETAAQHVRGLGAEVLPFRLDVSKAHEVEALGASTVQRFGVPNFVFNNAGVGAGGLIWENTAKDWEWVIGVNLMGVANGMRVHVPILQALSANSPFWRGDRSGLMSTRTPIFRAFPRVGIPPAYRDWAHYESEIAFMVDSGVMEDYTYLWYDVRPHPRFGTVEIRACDAQTRVEHTLGLTALIQAMVTACPPAFLQWCATAIGAWRPSPPPAMRCLRLHGAADVAIPAPPAGPGITLVPRAGHMLDGSHAAVVISWLDGIRAGLIRDRTGAGDGRDAARTAATTGSHSMRRKRG